MNFKIGDILSDWDVVQFVKGIHYNNQDFIDGDIREHIETYDHYEVKEVFVSDVEEPSYYLDGNLIEDYKTKSVENMPPIILGYYHNLSYLTIDGGHRITVAKELGLEKIKALVAIKNNI